MDLHELQRALQKQSTVETSRRPLVPAEKSSNGAQVETRRSRTREVSSRYRSPTPPVASPAPRRCPSPVVTRTVPSTNVSVPKRAVTAERKRPSTPPSPPSQSPSTPVQETSMDAALVSKKVVDSKVAESLWPSTMRSLSVSFQSDSFSLAVNKREKLANHVLGDRTLRPSSNVARKPSGTSSASRKSTPERKRSPLKGKNPPDQSENFRPVESVHSRLVEQHRWSSKTGGGKLPSSTANRSIDLGDKGRKIIPSLPHSGSGVPSLRRWSLDGVAGPLQKSASDLLALVAADQGAKKNSVDDNSQEMHKPASSTMLDRRRLMLPAIRMQSLPVSSSRPLSPKRSLVSSSPSVSRGASPSRIWTSSAVASRGPSPSRSRASSPSRQSSNPTYSRSSSPSRQSSTSTYLRPSSPLRQPSNPTSVLSFIADIKKGKKTENHLENVHQLRLLYNRHLQWRFANAQADIVLQSQLENTELTLNGVWRTISDLRDSVIEKRTELEQLMLKLKLFRVLNHQLAYLDEWSTIEGDHAESLSQTIKDLQISTLRLPITNGARGDISIVKAAVYSAVDVMQSMGTSMCHILKKVEEMNRLTSEVADVTSQERAMLDECDTLLSSTGGTQAMEYSLRTNLIQMKEGR